MAPPSRELHLLFDEHLRSQGVIGPEADGEIIHTAMTSGLRPGGPARRPFRSAEGVMDWIRKLDRDRVLASGEALTDYRRIALGHEVLRQVVEEHFGLLCCGEEDLDPEVLLDLAWKRFREKGYDRPL